MRVVPETGDEIELAQQCLHVRALDAFSSPVNEPHLAKSAGSRGVEVLARDVANFIWPKGMQVEDLLDRHLERLVVQRREILCDTLALHGPVQSRDA